MGNLDVVRDLALAGGAQVAEADGLLYIELARNAHDIEPLGQLIDCNQRHNGPRDGVNCAVGRGPFGVGPDNEEARRGGHGEIKGGR